MDLESIGDRNAMPSRGFALIGYEIGRGFEESHGSLACCTIDPAFADLPSSLSRSYISTRPRNPETGDPSRTRRRNEPRSAVHLRQADAGCILRPPNAQPILIRAPALTPSVVSTEHAAQRLL
ncbi:hypothetical protein HN011_012062 [Eciton burchellii]|nr:hypothetical protein HN011_012062 [Eciton burchellii]